MSIFSSRNLKRPALIISCLSLIFVSAFVTAEKLRSHVTDLQAIPLHLSNTSDAPVSLYTSDVTYNWIGNTLEYSLEIRSDDSAIKGMYAKVSVLNDVSETVMSDVTPAAEMHNGTVLLYDAVPVSDLSTGSFTVEAALYEESGEQIQTKNADLIPISVFAFNISE